MPDNRINRRRFFATGMGPSLGLALAPFHFGSDAAAEAREAVQVTACGNLTAYERCLAHAPHLAVLGRPHDWSAVRQCLHPFSPDRVIVIPDDLRYGDLAVEKLKADIVRLFRSESQWQADHFLQLCKAPKSDLCIRLMRVMSEYYHVPHYFAQWSRGLLERESLAPSLLGTPVAQVGLVHQFQRNTLVVPRNPPVDWWLFLSPHGIDYHGFDDAPVHVLFGVVVSRTHWTTASEVPTLCLAASLFADPDLDLQEVAFLDRAAAARHLNARIPSILDRNPWQ